MKALCWCGKEGFVEKRGSNKRIKHYIGFVDGKRKYVTHVQLGINGNQSMGINRPESAAEGGLAGGVGFEPTTPTLGG